MVKRLQDKVAIITGAGQTPGETIGNGRAMAVLFAREGSRLMLVDRNRESAEETQSIIEREGGKAIAFEADVTRAEDCKKMADACIDRYGKIDVLVNNVGTGAGDARPAKLSEEAWNRILDVNLKSMYLTCKYVLSYMEKQESGSIINISSAAAVCASGMLARPHLKTTVFYESDQPSAVSRQPRPRKARKLAQC